jgi:hypothetical protein
MKNTLSASENQGKTEGIIACKSLLFVKHTYWVYHSVEGLPDAG